MTSDELVTQWLDSCKWMSLFGQAYSMEIFLFLFLLTPTQLAQLDKHRSAEWEALLVQTPDGPTLRVFK